MRILGIDYGDARTGLSISDPSGFLAGSPSVIHEWNYAKLVGKLELGDDPGWSGNYRYEWCYWLVAGWFVLLYGAFFALLFPAARKQLRPSFAPLAIIAGLAIAYSLLYILRNAHFFSTNLALTYTILIVVAVEITLATGILPSYAWYRETFYKLPFDLKVLTRNGSLLTRPHKPSPFRPKQQKR